MPCFDPAQGTIDEKGIQPKDIEIFDEVGFAMGLNTTEIVTRAEYYDRQPANREWVTSIEYVNSTGFVLLVFSNYQRKIPEDSSS